MRSGDDVSKSAVMSACEKYRYRLERRWNEAAPLVFVMLNPSTADASIDDPTIRRCIAFAKREEAGGLIVVNMCALRATDPEDLLAASDAVGPDNRSHIAYVLALAAHSQLRVVCAWGSHRMAALSAKWFCDMARYADVPLWCLGKAKSGAPRHPLYIRVDQSFEAFP